MQDDHYVAQTYLKHFAGPSGLLRAYRKSDRHSFPCRPRDICTEPDGDVIRDFLSEPTYLGEFRSAFEPGWNLAVEAIKSRAPDARHKFHIAGFWAALMVFTPTWRRVAVEGYNQYVFNTVRAHNILSTELGKPDQKIEKAIGAVECGAIKIETEPEYVRAQSAISLLRHTWALYNADWDVFESDTELEFITSDNPASHQDQEITSGRPPFLRFLPITPRLCMMCDLTRNAERIKNKEPNFQEPPIGTIRGGIAEKQTVERINVWVAKCAEELILCTGESPYVCDLATKYSKFRVENEFMSRRHGKGFLLANRTRVIERGE